jgi:3-phosphoshikimate 1-carboxyvinyltransferase
MMGAIASLISEGPIEIENPRCVNKSYPNFYEDLNQLAL